MPLKTAGSTSTTQLSSIADTTIMTDQTFLMRYADNELPRFDGSVYAIKCSTVVKHKGVDVQGVTTTDLHEGDDIVYQYTYKHGRTRLWKGVVVRTESNTVQLVLSESSANSDADCVSDAGSNNEAKRTSAQSETILKGKRKSRKRTQKKAENLPPKKKAKGGECTCTYIGLICCWWVCCLLLVGLIFVVGGFVLLLVGLICCWWVCCLLVGLFCCWWVCFVVGGFVLLLVGLICCWWVCFVVGGFDLLLVGLFFVVVVVSFFFLVGELPISFWFQYFEITVTSCQLDFVFKML